MQKQHSTHSGRLWRHGPVDIIFVLLVLGFFASLCIWLWHAHQLPLWANAGLCLLAGLAHFYNYIVVSHEMMHTPLFTRPWMNRALATLSSVTLVYPMALIDAGHKLHHIYNNDPLKDGSTKDPSSTWLHGKNGQQENFISYILLNFFRANTPVSFRESLEDVCKRKRLRTQLYWEAAAVLASVIAVIVINPWFLVALFLYSYLGWILTDLQNYFEHYRASNPESRYANSVSYYGKIYNLLMFNEGFHQEHHIEPGAHWSQRPAVRERYRQQMEANHHYISPVPLSLGFLDRNPEPQESVTSVSNDPPEVTLSLDPVTQAG